MGENFFLNNKRLYPILELSQYKKNLKAKQTSKSSALLPVFILKMNTAEEISTEKSHSAYKEQRWGQEETSHQKPCKPKDSGVTSLTFWNKMLWIKYSKSDKRKKYLPEKYTKYTSREAYQFFCLFS